MRRQYGSKAIGFICMAIFLTAAWPILALAEDQGACEINAVEEMGLTKRAFSIKLPDGRQIEVVGHNHGDRALSKKMLDALNNPSLDDIEVKSQLKNLKAELSETLKDFSDDLRYLKSYIYKNASVDTVLWSETDEASRLHQIRDLHQIKEIRKESLTYLKEEILIASANPVLYFESYNKLSSKVQAKGVEVKTAESQNLNSLINHYETTSLNFSQLEAQDSNIVKNVLPLINEWIALINDGKFEELYDLRKQIRKIDAIANEQKISVELSVHLKSRLYQFLLRQVLSAKRDEQNILNILSENKSGILFIGKLHLAPSLHLLKNHCQQMLSQDYSGNNIEIPKPASK